MQIEYLQKYASKIIAYINNKSVYSLGSFQDHFQGYMSLCNKKNAIIYLNFELFYF